MPCRGHQPSPVPGRLPWDFRPFDVVSSRSPLTRVCLARYVPLPGFLNLLAACSSSNLVGLFHPTDIPGILSSRAFSSTRAVTPRRRPFPSCRCLPSVRHLACARWSRVLGTRWNGGARSVRRPWCGRARPCGRLQGFAHVSSSFGPLGCYPSWPADALLDFLLSRVCRPAAMVRISPDLLPCFGRRDSR